jgi:hypothetical protein
VPASQKGSACITNTTLRGGAKSPNFCPTWFHCQYKI